MNYDVGVIISRLLISPEPYFGVPSAVAAGAWYTLYTRSVAGAGSAWANVTLRATIPVAAYGGVPATGTQLRVTIRSGDSSGGAWDSIYVGHAAGAGDAYDFDGTQVQLLWSGIASGSIGAGTSLVSDAVIYAFDNTKPLVISAYISGSARLGRLVGATGFSRNFKTAVNEAATTDVTGYTTTADELPAFPQVEVYG